MRVLIVCQHHAVSHARYMRDAFRRLGVDVRTVGQACGTEIWDTRLSPERVFTPDGPADAVWPDWTPDLVIFANAGPYDFRPEYRGVPHVVHSVDNHQLDFRQPGIAQYFLGHLHGQMMPVRGPDVTWLPCAYDPVVFTSSPIPWACRRYDVSLIGVMYPQRVEMSRAMKAAGLEVCFRTGPVYEEYRDIYHATRISLCASLRQDVAIRIFETAAMRCLVLSDPCLDFPDLKADGVVLYKGIRGAVDAVRQLLADPVLAESLIERSHAWARPHTWDARARAILAWRTGSHG